MTTDDSTNRAKTDAGEKLRKILGLAILVLVSYEVGLGHGRSRKVTDQYAEMRAQYSALKAEYDHVDKDYLAMKNKCDATASQYAALKTQYDRIENRPPAQALSGPKK